MKFQDMIRTSVPKANKFDRSHTRKMTMAAGKLYPCLVDEVLPGDHFRVTAEMMTRMAPLVSPLMGRQNVIIDWWYVPIRIMWDEQEYTKFFTGGVDGLQAPVHPFMRFGSGAGAISQLHMKTGTLYDYMGLPTYDLAPVPTGSVDINAFPFRAYQMIWNECYRDQTLQPDLQLSKASGQIVQGAESDKLITLRHRSWEKDYFTSAQTTAQRGSAAGATIKYANGQQSVAVVTGSGAPVSGALASAAGSGNVQSGGVNARIETPGQVMITDLRRANRVQLFMEKMQLSGARMKEYLRHMWNEMLSDGRLQRPEHLGSSRSPLVISEVLSSVEFEDAGGNVPQGNMAGHGIGVGTAGGFSYRFPEHGILMGLISILPRTNYTGGFGDKFMIGRSSKFDYYTPDFAGLGEQAVENIEVGMDWSIPTVRSTFGYQSRYCEYKFKNSTSCGQFRNSLSHWTDDRIFIAPGTLNEAFVKAIPTKRFFAVIDETVDSYYVQLHFNMSCIRKIPYFNENRL